MSDETGKDIAAAVQRGAFAIFFAICFIAGVLLAK
jgi:hypothetical protein